MRIGIITYALDRASGGIGRYTNQLINVLRKSQVEPILLSAGSRSVGENAVSLPAAGLVPGLLSIGQVEIALAVRKLKLDLVHDPTGIMPLFFTPAARIVTIHDAFPLVYPGTSTALEKLIYRYWLPIVLRRTDAVITDSKQSKCDILQYLPISEKKVTVILIAKNSSYHPMAANEIRAALQRHAIHFPYILYVGSLEPRKNLIRLLHAYSRLRRWSTRWRLVIVGAKNFWKSTPVVETVRSLYLEEWVHFTGFVDEQDLPALYNGADLFVFPSLYEGFGLPPLEAMACGTPVVTSNVSSLPEVTGDAALLVDPYNVDEICEAMKSILSDADLAAGLRQKGLQRAGQFTWERMARETLAVYREVLNT